MVKIIAYLTLFYFSLQLNVYAQSHFLSSGYLSLTIKGKPSLLFDNMEIGMPMMSNSLLRDKPVAFTKLNDSTLYLSEYTYGPTSVYFRLNGRYIATMLLPNEKNVITVSIRDSAHNDVQFEGRYKEIFDNSALQEELIMNLFSYPPFKDGRKEVLKSADDFKWKQLESVAEMTHSLTQDIPDGFLKSYYTHMINTFKVPNLLFKDYDSSVLVYYKNLNLDVPIGTPIPERTLTYYDGIITSNYADTLTLMPSGYFDLLIAIQQDSLLQIPSIISVGLAGFKTSLVDLFRKTFEQEDNLFYDMMMASAYIQQINEGYVLNHQDLYQIDIYLKNKELRNYIFHQNELKKCNDRVGDEQVFILPFDKKNKTIVTSIIERYKDKVIIIDFWATWCGPCIQAFSEMDQVKKKYAAREDVVFVYLTDESSNRNGFQEYSKILGGEHFYVYKNQFATALEQFGFEYIPSYLVFDKRGHLTQKCTYPNDLAATATMWIERALKK
ncbi:TlpA family protein disulfide reductase [Sphingobacterium faecium]